ncbi:MULTISPECIES: BglG family transcription antiterminator [unclassified Clostridium]|uniref:BglG family transcription antiterminator n=1 Tax=unclassified Clostridium TaxID=2614128 RepID=UPI0013F7B9C2|nr:MULTISPECIES: BglG family transcription antiterminator [unclassified Clostridium]MBN1037440.1 transcription antiterminator [Clostridium botulinum]MBN1044102.1 transcription antiterminator [Clostridium botulinum]MBN1050791.1 transcription antiterminator [Clostridium botulinum]NFN95088.1 transcription antiterminator [Clostridium botulinum]NFS97003.1 transcription antiterminator [Clostridium botulinum]
MVTQSLERKLFTILEMLADSKGNALKDFSDELGVSTRSIRTYLKQLQEEIPKEVVEIVKTNNSEYKLNIKDDEKFKQLLELNRRQKQKFCQLNNPEERIDYLINRLVELNEIVTIDDLAEEMNVGRTTLVKDLKKVDQKLDEYGLVLKRKTNSGIKIEGDEINLRLIILEHICKTYNDSIILLESNNILTKKEVIKLQEQIVLNLKENKFSVTEALINNLIRYITVMLMRLKNDKNITSLQSQYKIIKESEEYEIGKTIKSTIEALKDKKIDDLEIIFIVMPLLGRNAPLYHEVLRNLTIGENITLLRKQIFDKVFEFTGLSLEEDEQLIQGLEYHLYYALNRIVLNIKYKNPMLKEIKEKYKLPYEVAKIAASVIEDKYQVQVEDDEVGYLALHFGTYVERAGKSFIKIENAAIICGTGLGTAKLLIIKLKKILGEEINFKSFSDLDFTEEMASNYDMIFTLVDLDIDTEIQIVKITSIFDESQLKGEIESQIFLNKTNEKRNDTEQYILNGMLDKKLVFYLNKNNFMDNLEYMLDSLIKSNIVSNEYKERVIAREKKAGTAFGGYIALPHAVDEKVNNVIVSYGILDKLIMVDGKEVGLIILLVIPSESQNSQDIIVKTYQEIIDLSSDKKIVQKLIKSKNYKEFKEVLGRR